MPTSARARTPPPPAEVVAASELPVAAVAVDLPLPHLDRPFDYLVPEQLAAECVPGCRVRVRFAGQDVAGFVLTRSARSTHEGRLTPIRRVVSSVPVLAPDVARLAREVADRYAGTVADVLRLAVPPRHARVERQHAEHPVPAAPALAAPAPAAPAAGPWDAYRFGPAFLAALAAHRTARAVWTALPGEDWPAALAVAAGVAVAAGRGALLIVPDHRDVDRLAGACRDVVGADGVAVLTADLGPAPRYRTFLAVRSGAVRCVVGTRAAAFAPVADLGLLAIWDDGDDLHAEPRAPYPHAREVLALRSAGTGASLLLAGFACTAEAAALVATGWARPIDADRSVVRARAPRVHLVGEADADLARDPTARAARLPHRAFEVARAALRAGPVLVQVPRRGYLPALACGRCRAPARCPACSGPLALPAAGRTPACRWCGRPAGRPAGWTCPTCGSAELRAPVVGARRTAEELGRAFPGVPVRTSGGDRVLDRVGGAPALVVATPGAEPVAADGYAAALLLDGWLLLARADLRAGEEALRRWLTAAALVRVGTPGRPAGVVVAAADPTAPAGQALVRWDPAGFARRELAERTAARLPPAVRLATVEGTAVGVRELLATARLPSSALVLGPTPIAVAGDGAAGKPVATGDGAAGEPVVRAVLRAPRGDGAALARALRDALAVRSAAKQPSCRVRIDPVALA